MNPRLIIDTKKLAANVRAVTTLCRQRGIEVTGVTKCCCGDPVIGRIFAENGVSALGDSRVSNLQRLHDIDLPKWLIRTPQQSEAAQVVRYADLSLNSELATIEALAAEASKAGCTHQVILMADLGDLREGFVDHDELLRTAAACQKMEGVELAGVGANLTCLSFIQADTQKMEELCALADRVKQELGCDDLVVSAGNSATLHLLATEGLPAGATNLRLGESLLVGRERACYQYLPGTHADTFVAQLEIVEAKEKPSKPWGKVGPDSYGVIHEFADTGRQVRAIAAAGSQDIDVEVMWPVDERVKVIAASCDHTVLDITACAQDYPVGSTVALRCGYHAILKAFTSPYVEKVYL